MPAGYPLYLATIHLVSDQIWLPIAGQHLLALATAVAVFLTLRRIDLSPAIATVGAALLLLPGDTLFLEHGLLTESVMQPLIVLAGCATIWGLAPAVDYRWLAFAGVLAALAAVTRSTSLVALIALAIVALLAAPGMRRKRLLSAGAIGAAGLLVIAVYVAIGSSAGGKHPGLTEMSGWNLYARVAPFAHCSQFKPPTGTERLCITGPSQGRPASSFFGWNIPTPPAPPPSPKESDARGRFARAAIAGQPKSYATIVVEDLTRYVIPGSGPTKDPVEFFRSAIGPTFMEFDSPVTDPAFYWPSRKAIRHRYSGISDPLHGRQFLGAYQRTARIHGFLLPLLLAAAVAGLVLARIAIGVFGLMSLGMFIVPVLSFSYGYRYGVTPTILLALAALIALASLVEARRA